MTEFEGMVQGVRGPEKRHHGLRDSGSVAVSTALPHVSPRPISLGPASGDIATLDEAAFRYPTRRGLSHAELCPQGVQMHFTTA
jgi:hypothetical protein